MGPRPVPGFTDWTRVELPGPDPAAGIRFGPARQAWSGVADTDGAPFRTLLVWCQHGARVAWDAGALPGAGGMQSKDGIGGWCDVFGGQVELRLPCRGVLTARTTDSNAGDVVPIFVATAPAFAARTGAEGVALEWAAVPAGTNTDFDIAPQGIIGGQIVQDPTPGAGVSAIRLSRGGAVFRAHDPAAGVPQLGPLDGGWTVNYSQGAGAGPANVAVQQRVPIP